MKPTACTLGYLIRGVAYGKDQRTALADELMQLLEHANAVTALPVVDGISVELEVNDIAPFGEESFESYVTEHILDPVVQARCEPINGPAKLKLIKKRFS